MNRNVVAVITGAVLGPIFLTLLYALDVQIRMTPAAGMAQPGPWEIFASWMTVLSMAQFTYFPFSAIVVGLVVSFIAKTGRWLCCVIAMLPITLPLCLAQVPTFMDPTQFSSFPFSPAKYVVALVYLAIAGLIGFLFQRFAGEGAPPPAWG